MPSSEELKIIIDATADGAKRAINDLKSHFDGLGGKIGHAARVGGEAMAAAGVAISGAMMKAVADTVAYGEAIDKVNKETGISTAEVQKFAYAAEQEHTSLDALEKGFGFLAKNMASNADAFNDLGIATQNADGSLRNTGDVMLDLADYMSTETNETQKAAVAKQLLGKAGLEMVPFLSMGRAEIARLGVEAGTLGMVLEDQTIKALEAFGDQVDKMKKSAKGLEMQIGTALLPAFSEVTDGFTDMFTSMQESGQLETIFGNIGGIISDLIPTFQGLFDLVAGVLDAFGPIITDVLGRFGKIFGEIVNALIESGLMDQVAELTGVLADAFLDVFEAAIPLIKMVVDMLADALKVIIPVVKAIATIATEVVTTVVDVFTGGAASAAKFSAAVTEKLGDIEDEWDNMSQHARDSAIAQIEAGIAALTALDPDKYAATIAKMTDSLDLLKDARDGDVASTKKWKEDNEKHMSEWGSMTPNALKQVVADYAKYGSDMVGKTGQISDSVLQQWRSSAGPHRTAMAALIGGGIDAMTSEWQGDKSKIEGIHQQMMFVLANPESFRGMGAAGIHDMFVKMLAQSGLDANYINDIENFILAKLGLEGQAGPASTGVANQYGGNLSGRLGEWGPTIQATIRDGLSFPAGDQGWLTGEQFGSQVYNRIMEWGAAIPPALRSILIGIPGFHTGGLVLHGGGGVYHEGGQVREFIRAHAGYLAPDERPAILQTREYVMQRSAVEKYGVGAMEAMNEGRLGLGGGVTIQKLIYQPVLPNVRTAADAAEIDAALDRKLRKVAQSAELQGGYSSR